MGVEIRVPSLGESVTEATVAKWFKRIGDKVTQDEPIVEGAQRRGRTKTPLRRTDTSETWH